MDQYCSGIPYIQALGTVTCTPYCKPDSSFFFYTLELICLSYFSVNRHNSKKFGSIPLTRQEYRNNKHSYTMHCDGNAIQLRAFRKWSTT